MNDIYKNNKRAYDQLEKYNFLINLYAALMIVFPPPYYFIKIRGSYAIFLYSLMFNERNINQIDLSYINPTDLDILLCYSTNPDRPSKHDVKLKLNNFKLNINGVSHIFETKQTGEARSKTFITEADVPIDTIDIVRCNKTISPIGYEYIYNKMNLISPKELFADYTDDAEFENQATEEQREQKTHKHAAKRNIATIIQQWYDVPIHQGKENILSRKLFE